MPSATISHDMPASSSEVFEVVHDYARRLEWDTLLRAASLTRGHVVAARGATSLCVGKPLFGAIGIESRYVSFSPGSIAAVTMVNCPPLFETFAASVRHTDVPGGSRLTYKVMFTARPRWLRWLLHPILLVVLRYETRRRLEALSRFLKAGGAAHGHGEFGQFSE